jgi:hypothetical protein
LNIASATGITLGAGMTATATGLLMQHAASDDAITPVRTGRSEPGGRTKTDNMKEHLTDRDLDAARRELNGEVVATKSNGVPWDHVDEVRNAQDGNGRPRMGKKTATRASAGDGLSNWRARRDSNP